ncbi:unnamed protein product [Lactuca saligna]|uniref:S-protein homolog n=1 Tax=Lactuca saligna TaxID=75948 RepID=A0AA35Z3Q7_LACSI|nr:unnamed protein product [Lactuca saligna]
MRSSTMHNLFIFAILTYPIASTAFSCAFTPKWNISVISAVPNDLVFHIKSGDDDLGNHTIPFVGIYSWGFCEKAGGGTLFYAYFWWGSKFQSIDLFDGAIKKICYLGGDTQYCYWFVKPDGFYVNPYPSGGGTFIKGWG